MHNYTTEYSSKKYYPGATFESTTCGEFKVLGKGTDKVNTYVIEFLSTGTVRTSSTSSLGQRCVKDPYRKTILGIACLGEGPNLTKRNGKMTKPYVTWTDMLVRCYGSPTKEPEYINVSVDSRWLVFQNFCEDIQKFEGYPQWAAGEDYHLDKDLLQPDCREKVYSRNTCVFLPAKENMALGGNYGR